MSHGSGYQGPLSPVAHVAEGTEIPSVEKVLGPLMLSVSPWLSLEGWVGSGRGSQV